MSVLARDIESYQRAVDQYQRQARNYNQTLFQDANGNVVVYKDGVFYSVPQEGGTATRVGSTFTDANGNTYNWDQLNQQGRTQTGDDPSLYLLRQNPTGTQTNTVTDLVPYYDDRGGLIGYQKVDANGNLVSYYTPPSNSVQYTLDPATGRYTATEYSYTFANKPREVKQGRPDPTAAQLRKLTEPSLAEQERGGLIASELNTGGVLSNPARKAPEVVKPPTPAEPPVELPPPDPLDPR